MFEDPENAFFYLDHPEDFDVEKVTSNKEAFVNALTHSAGTIYFVADDEFWNEYEDFTKTHKASGWTIA